MSTQCDNSTALTQSEFPGVQWEPSLHTEIMATKVLEYCGRIQCQDKRMNDSCGVKLRIKNWKKDENWKLLSSSENIPFHLRHSLARFSTSHAWLSWHALFPISVDCMSDTSVVSKWYRGTQGKPLENVLVPLRTSGHSGVCSGCAGCSGRRA